MTKSLIANEVTRVFNNTLEDAIATPEARASAEVYGSILLTVASQIACRIIALAEDPVDVLADYLRVLDGELKRIKNGRDS